MACAALKRPHNFDLLSSSPEKITGSPKRRRCGAVVSSCSASTTLSPFLQATPKLCRDELTKNVHDEWRRIQRRRRLISPNSPPQNTVNMQVQNSVSSSSSSGFSSSLYSNLASLSPSHDSMSSPGSMSPPREKDQPSLTVKQVVSLCERLWKEREEKLCEDYDKVLNERLSEQYDSFLKFTQDQIMKKYQHSSCSYVS